MLRISYKFILGLLVWISTFSFQHGYPRGAPTTQDSCIDLRPRHNNALFYNSSSSYGFALSSNYYQPCDLREPSRCQQVVVNSYVTVQGQGGLFRGFIIQARTPNGGTRSWGQFVPYNTLTSRVIRCQNGLTLTHTSNNDKQLVRFSWIPEPGMREQVQFVATIVQNLRTIYPKVYSNQIRPIGVNTAGSRTSDSSSSNTTVRGTVPITPLPKSSTTTTTSTTTSTTTTTTMPTTTSTTTTLTSTSTTTKRTTTTPGMTTTSSLVINPTNIKTTAVGAYNSATTMKTHVPALLVSFLALFL